jgi:hypothetical protein
MLKESVGPDHCWSSFAPDEEGQASKSKKVFLEIVQSGWNLLVGEDIKKIMLQFRT